MKDGDSFSINHITGLDYERGDYIIGIEKKKRFPKLKYVRLPHNVNGLFGIIKDIRLRCVKNKLDYIFLVSFYTEMDGEQVIIWKEEVSLRNVRPATRQEININLLKNGLLSEHEIR